MRGTIMPLTAGGYRCSLYLPAKYYEEEAQAKLHGTRSQLGKYPLVLLLGESNIEPIMTYVEQKMPLNGKSRGCKDFILLGIETSEWERDFSPWRAEPLSRTAKPFTGHADDFIATLQKSVIPHLLQSYRIYSDHTNVAIVGYSLAGLCALYSLYKGSVADNIACISGSLWFKNWLEFCGEQQIPADHTRLYRIYISLGASEKNTPNPVMATVDECTRKTFRMLQEQMTVIGKKQDSVFFEYTDGGHFDNVPQRIVKALLYLEKE